jgi:uncharacterized protein (DUF1501 family)
MITSGALFAWAYIPRLARAEGRDPRLLVIVLRGALDGLAAVAPVGDPDWVRLRGNDALLASGDNAGLPLDNFFALNPAMPSFHRMYKAGQAAIVHAVASPYRERSHFDGQDVLESGLTRPGGDTGWLNRALASQWIAREGTGRKADPFRYWLPEKVAEWREKFICYDIVEEQTKKGIVTFQPLHRKECEQTSEFDPELD